MTTRPSCPPLGGSSHTGTTRPPRHSLADPPGIFLHSGGLVAPLLLLHSVGIGAHSGGLAAPRVPPHYPGVVAFPTLAASLFSALLFSCPMAAPCLPPRRPSWRWLSRRRFRRPLHPPVALSPRFLECPMATPSAGQVPPRPPLTLCPMSCRCSRSLRSIPRCCPPRTSSSNIPRGPASARPCPRAPVPGPGRRYRPKGRRCWRLDGRGCCASVSGGRIRASWKMA